MNSVFIKFDIRRIDRELETYFHATRTFRFECSEYFECSNYVTRIVFIFNYYLRNNFDIQKRELHALRKYI